MFYSFVDEGLLVAGMPGVFHYAAWYGSAEFLDRLWLRGGDLEEEDVVICHLFSFANEKF